MAKITENKAIQIAKEFYMLSDDHEVYLIKLKTDKNGEGWWEVIFEYETAEDILVPSHRLCGVKIHEITGKTEGLTLL
jgi:hypothetical protein